LLKKPTIGCAKSRLIGQYKEPGPKRGSFEWLLHENKKIGIVLRTKDNTKPVFVSPGNLIDFKSSLEIVLTSATKYRLPEPIRVADHMGRQLVKVEEYKDVTA
jgi:deoxyribonuclease V